MGGLTSRPVEIEDLEGEGKVSDDNVIEEGDKQTWFGMGMMKEEKISTRKPWRNSLIIKLIWKNIGYHYCGGVYRRCGRRNLNECLLI